MDTIHIFSIFAPMIHYDEFILDNGLQVIVHEDATVPVAAVNLLYKVGSRNENKERTGFAHLFEHLMFGGSKNIEYFDEHLQKVGGENNAFTTPDFTNYYLTIPAMNLETAFWLESDRMLGLSFDPKVLEVQRKVVIEEFKQRYLNQPYGDAWLKLRPLAYKRHPYQWPTIGMDISHIENATMTDVRNFFYAHYIPNNAVLAVAGNVTRAKIEEMADKWFGPIPGGNSQNGNIPAEPVQKKKRNLELTASVPSNALYMAWHMGGRKDDSYHATDLLSDILGRGKASRLYQELVKRNKVFNTVNAYVSGSIDPGLFVVEGKVRDGISIEDAEAAVLRLINDFRKDHLEEDELDKVKTQAETSLAFSEVEVLNRAMNLAFFAHLGDPGLYNQELDKVSGVTREKIQAAAHNVLNDNNLNVLYYRAQEDNQ